MDFFPGAASTLCELTGLDFGYGILREVDDRRAFPAPACAALLEIEVEIVAAVRLAPVGKIVHGNRNRLQKNLAAESCRPHCSFRYMSLFSWR